MEAHPTREDFSWHGVEQIDGNGKDIETYCPICRTDPIVATPALTPSILKDQAPRPLEAASGSQKIVQRTTDPPVMSSVHRESTIGGVILNPGPERNTDEGSEDIDNKGTRFIRIRSCGHIFHATCLQQWLLLPDTKTCPLCRRDLFVASYGSEATQHIEDLKLQIHILTELYTEALVERFDAELRENKLVGLVSDGYEIVTHLEKVNKIQEQIISAMRTRFALSVASICMLAVALVAAVYVWL